MKINNTSFGKIIKVNAPVNSVLQITSVANGYTYPRSSELKEQINNIFTDLKDGEAFACIKDEGQSYIFTGKESQAFQKIYFDTKEKLDTEMLKHWGTDCAGDNSAKIINDYKKSTDDLISRCKNITDLEVNTDPKTGFVQSINVKA